MDNLTVTTLAMPGARWILQGLEKFVYWVCMRFKPSKSQSLVLTKGKVTDRLCFRLGEHLIPFVAEQQVKILGKVFNCSLKDTNSIKATSAKLEGWMKAVARSGLPRHFKARVYKHRILRRIFWPLLIYKVPMTILEGFEHKVSNYLCR